MVVDAATVVLVVDVDVDASVVGAAVVDGSAVVVGPDVDVLVDG